MKRQPVPSPTVKRLSIYLRRLEQVAAEGIDKISSHKLAESLEVTDAQVRKDLAHFGQFGQPGVGYRVGALTDELRRILGTDKTWNVIVVGAGDLGRALIRYKGFRKKGFNLVAAFDVSAAKVGRQFGPVLVHHLDELPDVVRRQGVKLAIVTVPAEAAQEVADLLCRAGVMGILNLSPTTLHTAPDVAVGPVDLAAHLEELSFLVGNRR